MHRYALFALLAAALFGASTPVAKSLLGNLPPVLLGGLLYLGSGMGLLAIRLIRDRGWRAAGLQRSEWPWLAGAILCGGVLAPVLLLYGLAQTEASTASLLLNLEAVATAVIAWVVFKENADRRVVTGMGLIVLGGLWLSWPGQFDGASNWSGPLAITAACALWAVDNNLTRKVSSNDALFIACSKGCVAGAINVALALSLGQAWPDAALTATTMLLGLTGYGFSLVLFVLALRGLGAARTGAYFSTAPFIGAAASVLLLQEPLSADLLGAAALMACGVWLHLTEHHAHTHTHEALAHMHSHTHDMHHQHVHDAGTVSEDGHTHWHEHAPLTHKHPHYPDSHHQHAHP